MRADRLLSLVLLLRARGRLTAATLASELEVSTRTVLRDIDALSAAGIPVYAERGRDGGFALLPGFSTDLTGLTPDEAVALLTAQSSATPEALGLGPAFASAIRKVVAALPASTRPGATEAAGRVLVDPKSGGWTRRTVSPPTEPEPPLAIVQRAVFAGTRLRIRYPTRPRDPEPELTWRVVDPLGLVSAAGRWYLLALHDGADRTYRVSRIVEAVEEDEPAHRPTGIDLAQLWQRRQSDFRARLRSTAARVRVRTDRLEELTRTALGRTATHDDVPGWLVVDLEFADLGHAEHVVWGLSPHAEALSPAELLAALSRRAAATASLYP
ncbi:helix-turn-helix transcriptional regulator [Pseudonocardia spinosispora]|uniref:helix-turn-helix transcriptional regulator n=1 Tax=Pseudonocardia spinosispora TaxID=103441 RepID=UPI0003F64C1F|nr:WYL domain-containing protein [Pseudonocardia spinosispora]